MEIYTKPCDSHLNCKGIMTWYEDKQVFDGQWECNTCSRLYGANKPDFPVIVN
jgi:hypothetical protein